MTRAFARAAFLLSGVAGLTFEIVWMRHLGFALGATTLAVATTTAAYMGGLALGSHLGGKLADRLTRPLAFYGAVEIAIGLTGLAIPALCALVPTVDAALFAEGTGGVGRALLRFLVAALVLGVPTTAMGATLPVLARAVTDHSRQVGREVGILYALNIAGAMFGAVLAGFFWIPSLGLAATNHVAVLLDVLLGAVALVAGVVLKPRPAVTATSDSAPILRPGSHKLVLVLAVTGAAAMALQVLWTRALGTALGPSIYAFSAIVCTYLAGLALGGALAAWFADRITQVRLGLAVVLLLTGGFVLFGVLVVDDLPLILQDVVLDQELTMRGLVRSEFGLAALSALPATVGMGAIFPLTLSAVVGSDRRLGAAVGRAYAVNTVGNIAGSTAAVFVLLPLTGVEWGMRVGALIYLGLALVLLWRVEPSVRMAWRRGLYAACVLLIVATLAWPGWKVSQWTSGMFRLSMTRYYYPDGTFEPARVIFHKDGRASTVTVEEDEGARWIKVNGKIDGSSQGDMPTQVLSGLLPMLFHANPQDVAVVGCGSGVTVGSALAANPARVTLVELESAVVEAAALFEEVNGAPWRDARTRVIEDDGRNYMARTREQFDIIISEPSNPWMTGAASLFTVEFFRIARARLRPQGVFLQWLQIYELAPERIASVLKTFQSVFPHVLVFSAHVDSNDLLLVGSAEPLRADWTQLSERFAALAPELERAELKSLPELLALLLITDAHIAALPTDTPLNTDDNAFVEFGAPRDLLTFAEEDPEVPFLDGTRGERAALVLSTTGHSEAERDQRAVLLAQGYLRQGNPQDAGAAALRVQQHAGATPDQRARAAEIVTLAQLFAEDDREVVVDGAVAKRDPEYAALTRLVQAGDDELALEEMEKRLEVGRRSPTHTLLYGFLLYRNGEYNRARRTLLKAQDGTTDPAWRSAIAYYLAKQAFEAGDFERAITDMTSYRALTRGQAR